MGNIHIGAIFNTSNCVNMSDKQSMGIAKRELSRMISDLIVDKDGFITRTTQDMGNTYRAEAYVLTGKEFDELIERIRREAFNGWPSMIGGACTNK